MIDDGIVLFYLMDINNFGNFDNIVLYVMLSILENFDGNFYFFVLFLKNFYIILYVCEIEN